MRLRAKTSQGMVRTVVALDAADHKQLRLIAVEENTLEDWYPGARGKR